MVVGFSIGSSLSIMGHRYGTYRYNFYYIYHVCEHSCMCTSGVLVYLYVQVQAFEIEKMDPAPKNILHISGTRLHFKPCREPKTSIVILLWV